MKTLRPFLFLASIVMLVSLACGLFSSGPETQPTLPPIPTQPQQQQQQEQPTPQQQQEQPTQEAQPIQTGGGFYTEEFNADPQWYYEVIEDNGGKSDPANISINFDDGLMIFEIPDPFLYAYYLNEGFEYEDVRVEVSVNNRGVNSQQVSLVCRFGEDGWYEWAVQSDGLWFLFAAGNGFNRLTNGGSNDIHQGKDSNVYAMECKGDQISFFINGEEQKGSPYIDRDYGLRTGNVGFAISSLRAVPVKIEVDKFTISEP